MTFRGVSGPIHRRVWAAGLAVLLGGASVTTGAAMADTGGGARAATTSVLAWQACEEDPQAPLPAGTECADVQLPIDYSHPERGTTRVAVARTKAGDPAHRIGALVIHSGGPGPALRESIGYFRGALGTDVANRFDIVAIDPRGTGRSQHVSCPDIPGEPRPAEPVTPAPTTKEEIRRQLAWDDYGRRSCARAADPLLDHVSTADHARDIDAIRGLLGEQKISYIGGSYGTFVAQTYAAMYPNRVRAMVMDAVVDAAAYTTPDPIRPATVRAGVDAGLSEAVRSSMAVCDKAGPSACALAPSSLSKYDRLRAMLLRDPLKLSDGRVMTRGYLDAIIGSDMSYAPYMTATMQFVNTVNRLYTERLDPTTRAQLLASVEQVLAEYEVTPPTQNMWDWMGKQGAPDGQHVSCLDEPGPVTPQAYPAVAALREKQYPGGSVWTWAHSLCVGWPGSRAASYAGPWDTRLTTPPLLLANTHDPATPITGARKVAQRMPGARMVTVDTWGHGITGDNTCVAALTRDYLVDLKAPTRTTCPVDDGVKLYGVG